MEIERKFLVNNLPDLTGIKPHKITQGYISTSPDLRIRKDEGKFYLTMKGKGTLCREEYTLGITAEEYTNLIPKCDGIIIEKDRYHIPLDGGDIAELDIFTGALAGLQVVEVEFLSEDQANNFVIPEWFSTDVTHDKTYKNSSLSKGLPKEI